MSRYPGDTKGSFLITLLLYKEQNPLGSKTISFYLERLEKTTEMVFMNTKTHILPAGLQN